MKRVIGLRNAINPFVCLLQFPRNRKGQRGLFCWLANSRFAKLSIISLYCHLANTAIWVLRELVIIDFDLVFFRLIIILTRKCCAISDRSMIKENLRIQAPIIAYSSDANFLEHTPPINRPVAWFNPRNLRNIGQHLIDWNSAEVTDNLYELLRNTITLLTSQWNSPLHYPETLNPDNDLLECDV